MLSEFDSAFENVVGIEGGYVNDPDDPGGETKYGISKRSYPHLDIKNLTLAQAKAIYYNDYWIAAKCDWLPEPLNVYVFDAAVNQGLSTAIKLLQETVGVPADGVFGNQTKRAVAAAEPKELADLYAATRAMRYVNTNKFNKYGKGWFKRLFNLARKG